MNKSKDLLALVLITNGISATMARGALAHDGYSLDQVILVKQRKVNVSWADECAQVIEFKNKASLTLLGQVNQIGFYSRLLKHLRPLLMSDGLRDVYIPNIDNLVNNQIVQQKRRGKLNAKLRISVIAEGLMNYQNISDKDRAGWRWMIKPALAAMMRLRYVKPDGHLSGAFEAEVERVFAYSEIGLFAPPEKVVLIPFPRATPTVVPPENVALIVMTGIAQWMAAERFAEFKSAFAAWVNAQGFDKVFTKAHPHYPSGGIEELLERSVPLADRRGLEEMAAEIPASVIIGYCSTALVTLRLMRPDLRVLDWGSDFYCEHAYHGDRSVVAPLRGAGVEIIEMSAGSSVSSPMRSHEAAQLAAAI